jgi:hypothetical protein
MLCVHVISWKKLSWPHIIKVIDNNSFAKNEIVSVQVVGGLETIMHLLVF